MQNTFRQTSRRIPWAVSLFVLILLGLLPASLLKGANRTAATLGGNSVQVPGGTFESPSVPNSPGYQYRPTGSNWNFYGSSGLTKNGTGFTVGNPGAPQGSQVLFLQGTGRITQSMNFVAGYYRFEFKAAQRGNHQATYQVFELRIDGNTVGSFQPNGTAYQTFKSNAYYLSSGSHTVELRGMNPNGGDNTAFVDDLKYIREKRQYISGFESPVLPASPGFQYSPSGGPWTFYGGSGLSRNNTGFTSGNPAAPEGNQVLFLQQTAYVQKSVSISHAGYYRITFKSALRGNNMGDGEAKNVRIKLGSLLLGEFVIPNTSYTEFITLPAYFSAGTYTLEIRGINTTSGDNTAFVDDVRMELIHDWHDAQVWGGSVPNANDAVTVPMGSAVVMRGTMNAKSIMVMGEMAAAQNRDVELSADNIMVMGSGSRFDVGQELVPYEQNFDLELTASSSDPEAHPAMGNNYLGVMGGGILHLHGEDKVSWSRLGANVAANATQITMMENVDWEEFDEIVIVSSRKNWQEAEKVTVDGVSGTTVTLKSSLNYPHKGVIKTYSDGSRTWQADLRAEVGLLTHNITIRGNDAAAAADGFGGHIMIMGGSYGYASGIELYNMGQKSILARYPWHWHMLKEVGADQYLKNSSVHQSYNRAVTIHGTESTLVEGNFFYDHIGHGVFLEDGTERFNVIRKNVTLYTMRPADGEQVVPSDNQFNEVQNRTPSSYWITNPQNTFEDNVAAGTHGTGYWFAFPTSPMGLSASDPRFAGMQPHTLPLISFKGNSAHSCMTGFDIFDQLAPNDSILKNKGWANSADHIMENCLWYANDLALYSGIGAGGPVDNLKFRNNVFVENKVGIMFASYSIVENSVLVASSGEGLYNPQKFAYRVYDGAGQVHNSHFIGWNASDANLLLNTGAAIKHPNHYFYGNTTNHTGYVRCSLPNFDIAPTEAHANHPGHPRYWSVVIRDVTGGITGVANTTLVGNQPFNLVGDEFQPSNWTHAYRSNHQFALALLNYDLAFSQIPNVTVTREKAGTPTEHVYYIDGYKEHHQLPFIVNEDFLYTYTYEALPSSKKVRLNMRDAQVGDEYLVRFKDFGKLGGRSISSSQGSITAHSSLNNLKNASSSGYFVESNGDLYLKPVATGRDQSFLISWSTNFTVPPVDTDGDELTDSEEMAENRNPFTAADLSADFTINGDFEGWTTLNNISGGNVSGNSLNGTSINNGDAMIINNAFNFAAGEVPYIKVRMKASQNSGVNMFFSTNSASGFSATRRVDASYTGNGAWQVLTFNMAGHSAWNGTITALRFDVVSGVNISFNVGWISASSTAKTADFDGLDSGLESGGVTVSPVPFQDRLNIHLGGAGQFNRLRLLDLQGKVLREITISPDQSLVEWSLEDLRLKAGVYFVECVGEGRKETLKVVKL